MPTTAPSDQIWLGSRLEITYYGSHQVCAKCHACITKCTVWLKMGLEHADYNNYERNGRSVDRLYRREQAISTTVILRRKYANWLSIGQCTMVRASLVSGQGTSQCRMVQGVLETSSHIIIRPWYARNDEPSTDQQHQQIQ